MSSSPDDSEDEDEQSQAPRRKIRRLTYESLRVFNDAAKFKEWWKDAESKAWTWNSQYPVKNDDQIVVYW